MSPQDGSCQKLQNNVYAEKKLWHLFSGHRVFLQTLNFPVKFQRKDRDRGRQIREGCEKYAILQPIRRCSLSQKRCKMRPKLLVMPPAPLTPGQLPASTPRRGTYHLRHTSKAWYITSYNHPTYRPLLGIKGIPHTLT